jgi:signal peptidase I
MPEQRHPIAEWGITIIIALWASSSLAWPFVVPTGSMENTILVGDHLIVDKLAYSPSGPVSRHILPYTDVRRGDIIVFRYPVNLKENYVKRVIGVPGDRIRFERQQLILNGKVVNEPYVVHKAGYGDSYRDDFPAAPPSAHMDIRGVRMLEENDQSWDSRYWGFVPRENIVGKPWIIYWSFQAGNPEGPQQAVNFDHFKDIAVNFFSKTRWDRTFRIPKPYPLD